MRGLLLLLLLVCLPLSPCMARDTTTIAAFGDSLFAGLGLAPSESLPSQLEKRLLGDGYNVKILNDGISGDTTAGGVARVDNVLAQKPDLVILELGANDMLRGFPPEQARTNIDTMLTRFKQVGIRVLVIGQKSPASYGKVYTGAFDPLFCELAKKYGDACYPFYFEGIYGHPELFQADGIHPNTQGVMIILDKLYPSVTALLKK